MRQLPAHPLLRRRAGRPVVAYIDGGARGNPGPAGFGVRVEQADGSLIEEFGESIGVAMAEARGGVCTICHVRLRPQVFNTVLRNDSILQCDHCNRILYYVPVPASAAAAPSDPPAPPAS